MELDKLHVHKFGTSLNGECMPVTGVFPTVARHTERSTDATRCEYDRVGMDQMEPTTFTVVGKGACDSIAILEQSNDRGFHQEIDALMNTVILKGPNHFQTGTVTDMRKSWVFVPSKVTLEYSTVLCPIEQGAPFLEFTNTIWSLPGVQFCHTPVVEILPPAHRVREVDLPVVTVIDMTHRGRHATFRHYRMGLAEQRFAQDSDLCSL
jgi:hypothetical protein